MCLLLRCRLTGAIQRRRDAWPLALYDSNATVTPCEEPESDSIEVAHLSVVASLRSVGSRSVCRVGRPVRIPASGDDNRRRSGVHVTAVHG